MPVRKASNAAASQAGRQALLQLACAAQKLQPALRASHCRGLGNLADMLQPELDNLQHASASSDRVFCCRYR